MHRQFWRRVLAQFKTCLWPSPVCCSNPVSHLVWNASLDADVARFPKLSQLPREIAGMIFSSWNARQL